MDKPTQEELWIEGDAGAALARERAAAHGHDSRSPAERREDTEAIERYRQSRA